MSFKCTKCGLCCRNIHNIPQLAAFDLGNGVCKYLKNNLCSIYEERPEICRVDYMYELYFKDKMSLEEYYRYNHLGCMKLQDV